MISYLGPPVGSIPSCFCTIVASGSVFTFIDFQSKQAAITKDFFFHIIYSEYEVAMRLYCSG